MIYMEVLFSGTSFDVLKVTVEMRIKGYSGAEIARMYGVKNNNVTSWISKARTVLEKECVGFCV